MKSSALPHIGVIAVVSVAVFGAGAAASWMYLNPSAPPALAKPTAADSTPVAYQDFSDERTVSLDVTRVASVTVNSGLGGRVTSSTCAPGGEVQSGTRVLSINEQPVTALATSVPLWRDLVRGDRGPDVKSLQAELARLGYRVTADGSVGAATLNATRKLFAADVQGERATASVPASRVLWIPAPSVRAESCTVAVGNTVAAGDPVFTLAGGLARVAVAQLPSNLVPGGRTLTVGSTSVSIGGDGVVSDAAALTQLERALPQSASIGTDTAAGTANPATGDAAQITAQLALTEPVAIGVVPPTAVYAISGTTGCVSQRGVPFKVSIVGSQLGQTYIQLPAGKTPKTVDLSEAAHRRCT